MTIEKNTILCVDDEADILDSLSDTFIDEYNVKTAENALDALKIFEDEDIFLVISDQRMPEMTGSEFLAEINKKKKRCKKILLTGYSDINAAVDAINQGSVDKYFSKPWNDEELLEAVNHLHSLYKMDVFMDKMVSDGKGLRKKLEEATQKSHSIEGFLDNYPAGICIVDDQSEITHLNKEARNIMQCKDPQNIIGTDYREIFLLKEKDVSSLEKDYQEGKLSFKSSEAKIGNGSSIQLLVGIIFKKPSDKPIINGIVFGKAE